MDYKLEFDPEKHEYRVGGIVKPSISGILKSLNLSKDYTGVDPFYRDRGIAVHKAIEFWLKDELDETSIDAICHPFFTGFQNWWKDEKLDRHQIRAVEEPLYSQRLDFCGTLDLVIGEVIVDYKCSKSPDPVSELQGALQQVLWAENEDAILLPFRVLQLPGDGSYKVIDYKTKDPNLADSIISLYNWRVKR